MPLTAKRQLFRKRSAQCLHLGEMANKNVPTLWRVNVNALQSNRRHCCTTHIWCSSLQLYYDDTPIQSNTHSGIVVMRCTFVVAFFSYLVFAHSLNPVLLHPQLLQCRRVQSLEPMFFCNKCCCYGIYKCWYVFDFSLAQIRGKW